MDNQTGLIGGLVQLLYELIFSGLAITAAALLSGLC